MNHSLIRRACVLVLGSLALLGPGSVGAGTMRGAAAPPPAEERTVAAPATEQGWTYLGPQRATVEAMAVSPIDPDRLLVVLGNEWEYTLGARLWETDSAGAHWAHPPNFGFAPVDVVIDDHGRALAANNLGILEHTGGDPAWELRQPPDAPGTVQTRLLEAAAGPSPDVWVAGLLDNMPRVFRITSFDQPWLDVTPPLPPSFHPHGVAVSRTAPGAVAVAAAGNPGSAPRVWVTLDNGGTWHERSNGLPEAGVVALRWLGERLYLAFGDHANGASGLAVSADLGLNWQQIYGGPTADTPAYDVAVDPANPDRLWVGTGDGVHRSDDGGLSWDYGIGGTSAQPTQQLRFDAATGRLWAGLFDRGVWLSTDGGESFSARDHRLNPLPTTSVAISPVNPAEMAAAHSGAFFGIGQVSTSGDGGLDWNPPDHSYSRAVHSVRFDSQGRLYATLTGPDFSQHTLFRRDAPGVWTNVGFSVPQSQSMALHKLNFGVDDDTLLLSARVFSEDASAFSSRVWRSGDAGQTWHLVRHSPPGVAELAQIERVPTPWGVRLFLYERTYHQEYTSRVLASDDDGLTWRALDQGLPDWVHGAMCVGDGGQMSLVVQEGQLHRLYRSFDYGDTWARTAWEPHSPWLMGRPFHVLHCPGDGQRIMLGGLSGNLWMSTDGGDSFPTRIGSSDTWGTDEIRDIQSSSIGMYVAHRGGIWVHTGLGLPPEQPRALQLGVVESHMRVRATLAWSGGEALVDIRRNGAVVATVANTGTYRDTVPVHLVPPGTTWQACNAGTSECSAVVERE